jgi:hypothetical protein
MNRKSLHLTSAILLALAAGCDDQPPTGPPPGVDLDTSQTPAATTAPDPSKPAKTVKRGEVHRPGPSMKLQ